MREAPVAIHVIGLDGAPGGELTSLLDHDERARAARFVFPGDQQRYTVAHAALRLVLAAETGIPAMSLHFATGRYGKPRLENDSDVGFNLSHSDGLALIAVSHGHAVGVDLEAIRHDVEPAALGKRFFSCFEQADLMELPADQRVRSFFNAWTRKEAYLKGRGDGITFGLDHFDMTLAPDAPAALQADRRDPDAARRWSVTDLSVPPGFVGALALEGAAPRVTYHSFPSRWNL